MLNGFADGTIKLWDLENGLCLKMLDCVTRFISCVRYLDNNEIIVTIRKNISIWSLETGKCLRTLKGHTAHIRQIEVLDDNQIASCSNDHSIRIWNFQTGACVKQLNGHTKSVCKIKALSNSQKLVSISYDKTIKVWDLNTDSSEKTIISEFPPNNIDVVTDTKIVISFKSKTKTPIKMWDLTTGECLLNFLCQEEEMVLNIKVISSELMISVNSRLVAKLWNLRTGICIKTFEKNLSFISDIAIISNEQIAIPSTNRQYSIFNLVSEKFIQTFGVDESPIVMCVDTF